MLEFSLDVSGPKQSKIALQCCKNMKKYIAALHIHRFNGKLLLDPFKKYNILKN